MDFPTFFQNKTTLVSRILISTAVVEKSRINLLLYCFSVLNILLHPSSYSDLRQKKVLFGLHLFQIDDSKTQTDRARSGGKHRKMAGWMTPDHRFSVSYLISIIKCKVVPAYLL